MRIRCLDCGFLEEVNLDFFVKILGGATAGFGFWAWTSFLFAGTGFAMAICIAIITGGAAMLAYKDEIIDWIANEGYECDSCGKKNWTGMQADAERTLTTKLAIDSAILSMDATVKVSRMGCNTTPTSAELQAMLTDMVNDDTVVKPKAKPKAKAKAKPKAKAKKPS